MTEGLQAIVLGRMPPQLVTTLRRGLAPGENRVLDRHADLEVGLDFTLVQVAAGTTYTLSDPETEVALVVIAGAGELRVDDQRARFSRKSWIDENPAVAHGARGARFEVHADEACEVAVVATANPAKFPSRVYTPADVPVEHRGKGMLGDTAYRLVRLAFDRKIAPPEAHLVLGEVVTLPGRWSSYPPHHHAQPEIYYYRFSPPQGYGHGECGDEVYRLQEHDVLRITAGRDHAQVAAPGYHMYYLWAIRHLPGKPYDGFEYAPEHKHLLEGGPK